ncbi:cytochrome P450 4F6-like [Sycon ciliatum]|uniref:cytochrome P450 4F6-like n=1 Tax=Sycon ciliatum TaxID=27933 RepID=UPI0031F64467
MLFTTILRIVAIAVFSLLVAKVLHVLATWWMHRRYLMQRVRMPSKPHWLRGHALAEDQLPSSRETFIEFSRKLPRMFLQQMGPAYMFVALSHPDTISEVMRTSPGKSEFIARFIRIWLGNNLIYSKGKRWERDHRMLSGVFTPDMRREYIGAFKDAASTLLGLWEGQVGRRLDVSQHFQLLTFDIILQCAMGAVTNCQADGDLNSPAIRYSAALQEITDIIMNRFRQPWFYPDIIFLNSPTGRRFQRLLSETHAFSEELIRERRALLQTDAADDDQGGHRHRDMLDIMLTARDEDGIGLSDTDIREHVETFLFAGHDTTSSTFQWIVCYLSQHQDVQERCRREVQDVLERCGGMENFAHEHLAELEYVTYTIQETLRVASIVPFVLRVLGKETTVDGNSFFADTAFQLSIIGVHHNEEIWTDPHKFNPDRFSTNKGRQSPYAFIPFSCGTRACIGKHFAMDEMKTVLSMILAKFRLLPAPDQDQPKWMMSMVVKPDPAVIMLEQL